MVDDNPSYVFATLFVILVVSLIILGISLIFGALEFLVFAFSDFGSQARLAMSGTFILSSIAVGVSSIGLIFLSSSMRERFPHLQRLNDTNTAKQYGEVMSERNAEVETASWELNSIEGFE